MSEEIEGLENEEQQTEDQQENNEPDYKALYEAEKANSRKWENRSKANKAKADELDRLKDGAESVEKRIAALEAEKKRLEDEKERAALVKAVAKSTGVPESIVSSLSATDEDSLTAQAQAIAENYKAPGGAPSVPEAGKYPKEKPADDDEKRKFVRELFGNN